MRRPRSRLVLVCALALPLFVGCGSSKNPDNLRFPREVSAGGKLRGSITYLNNTDHPLMLSQINVVVALYGSPYTSFGSQRTDYSLKRVEPKGTLELNIELDISSTAEGDATVEIQSTWIDEGRMRHETATGYVTITR